MPETQPFCAHWTAVLMNSTEAAPVPLAGWPARMRPNGDFQRIENRDSAPANDRSPSVVALQGGNCKGRGLATGFPLERRNRPDHDGTARAPHNGRSQGFDDHLRPDPGRVAHGQGEQGSLSCRGIRHGLRTAALVPDRLHHLLDDLLNRDAGFVGNGLAVLKFWPVCDGLAHVNGFHPDAALRQADRLHRTGKRGPARRAGSAPRGSSFHEKAVASASRRARGGPGS